jgi:hypothetical protein
MFPGIMAGNVSSVGFNRRTHGGTPRTWVKTHATKVCLLLLLLLLASAFGPQDGVPVGMSLFGAG